MTFTPRAALALAKELQALAPKTFVPPSEGTRAVNEFVVPFSVVKGTRGYIEKVANQVNGCYEKGWFDGCAVMMRRMIEMLIIECYEANSVAHKISHPTTGNYLRLSDLVNAALNETSWKLSQITKRALPRLKDIGDRSAHSRRYNALREDIDKRSDDFRTVCEELLYIARLK